MKAFGRIARQNGSMKLTARIEEKFIATRMTELPSPESIDSDLRALRLILNQAIEWKHLAAGANPFAGKKGATIGKKRKRKKELGQTPQAKHYSRAQIVALLEQTDKEVKENPKEWELARLRALVYFVAYTGVRLGEALYLEWKDLDLDAGVANISFKIEHGLKTESSANYVGLPDVLVSVLTDWKNQRSCDWVFPNAVGHPWSGGQPGTKPLDRLKELAVHAKVGYATWKMFRHSFNTHGKQWFRMTREQIRMQLRHASESTQKHYDQQDKENLRAAVRLLDYRGSD